MSDKNKAIVHQWTEVWNGADPSTLADIASDDVVFHSSQLETARGLAQLTETIQALRAAFPDGKFSTEEIVAEGDTVVNGWTFRGTQKGEWMGQPPSGLSVETKGVSTNHFRNGKIVEHSAVWDAMAMLQQLGVLEA